MNFGNIFKIWKKDLKSYFYTPMAYVFIGGFSFVVGIMFFLFLRAYVFYERQQAMMGGGESITIDRLAEALYGNVNMLLLFVIPFFTMGLFTDEIKKNTLVLLLTSPIRTIEIVLGKFLSALTVVGLMLALTLIFPIFLSFYSHGGWRFGPDPGVVASTYLGLILISSLYISVGLFWSSISNSALTAVMLTFANLFSFWLISFAAQSTDGTFKTILSHMAVMEQFTGLMQGTIDLKSLVFFASGIFLALFLTQKSVESYSWRS